jgi:hypothetical protein
MLERKAVLCTSDEIACLAEAAAWRQLILKRLRQVQGRDAHITLARVGDAVIYLIEGEVTAVSTLIDLIGLDCDTSLAVISAGPIMVSWDARPGRLMTPMLTAEELRWLEARLETLDRAGAEMRACLRWASMRTRETAYFDFGAPLAGLLDPFPLVATTFRSERPPLQSAPLDLRAN